MDEQSEVYINHAIRLKYVKSMLKFLWTSQGLRAWVLQGISISSGKKKCSGAVTLPVLMSVHEGGVAVGDR